MEIKVTSAVSAAHMSLRLPVETQLAVYVTDVNVAAAAAAQLSIKKTRPECILTEILEMDSFSIYSLSSYIISYHEHNDSFSFCFA